MNIDIAQIIELDRLNMPSIIEDTGGKFDWDRRQEGLLAEIEKEYYLKYQENNYRRILLFS